MIIGIILCIIAFAEVLLGVYILTRYQRSIAIVGYCCFAFSSALYVAANGIGYLSNTFFIGEKISWIGGIFATIFFLAFSFNFPLPRKTVKDLFPWVVWPAIIFGFGTLFTQIFIRQTTIVINAGDFRIQSGGYLWVMLVFIGIYWVWSLTNLLRNSQSVVGSQRRNVQLIFLGTLISLIATITFDIIIPLITVSNLGYVGSLFNAAWVAMTSYILVRKV